MAAFVELTTRDNTVGEHHKVLVNSSEIRKVYSRNVHKSGTVGTVLVWSSSHGEYANPQLEVAESYDDVCALLGCAEMIVALDDAGDVVYRSLP